MRPNAIADPAPMLSPSTRTKKLIATIAILIWLPLYSLLAMHLGIAILPQAGSITTLLYYAIAGTAWILPIGLLLPWIHREPHRRP